MKTFLLLIFFSFPMLATPSPKIEVEHIISKVQKIYDNTKEFSGDFLQTFHHHILRRKDVSTGKVQFKKPGYMRWDYETPSKKSFIVDGKNLWIVQYQDNLALVDRCFKQDGLTASIAFLWGQGKIKEQFNVKFFDGRFGEESDLHLELNPKHKNGLYRKLVLVVDPKSYHVKQSIVVDLQGNVNQFAFNKVQMNRNLKISDFVFVKPKEMRESSLPGSCSAK